MEIVGIILNWENYADTSRLLDGLDENHPDLAVRVVDNGSTDRSAEQLKADGRDVIELESNRGFAGGMNAGIQAALDDGADDVLLLNNDLIVEHPFLDRLIAILDSSEEIGAVSPAINTPDGSPWFRTASIDMRTGESHRNDNDPSGDEILQTDYIPLACTLISASVFSDVGLLDESYFLYKEDADFAVRASNAGYRFVTDSTITVLHDSGNSSGSSTKRYYGLRNRWIFARKHNLPRSNFYPFIGQKVIEAFAGRILKHEFSSLPAVLRGAVDGIRGKTGRGAYP